jgi:hypothetical protein
MPADGAPPDDKPDKSDQFNVRVSYMVGAGMTVQHDGKLVASYEQPNQTKPPRQSRPTRALDPARLAGPKLKVERAKCHIANLEAEIHAFHAKNPYAVACEKDTDTGENVFRLTIKECLPVKLSAILGDIIHNLRTALDHLISDLIRANGMEPDGDSGFPITQRSKNLKPGRISKIKGVSPKAERLILRLKPYKTGNPALWNLHMLDVLDKHAGIIPVAAATLQAVAQLPLPGLFRSPDGAITLGGLPGWEPVVTWTGIPGTFKPVYPLENNIEIYRSAAGLQEHVQLTVGVAFGKGQIPEGEPIVETIKQYADLIEHILGIFERSCVAFARHKSDPNSALSTG